MGAEAAADERATRARRVREIQELLLPQGTGDPRNIEFAEALTKALADLNVPHAINPNRVAKLRTGGQLLQFEDVAAIEAIDPLKRGWLWVVFGVERQQAAKQPGGLAPMLEPQPINFPITKPLSKANNPLGKPEKTEKPLKDDKPRRADQPLRKRRQG